MGESQSKRNDNPSLFPAMAPSPELDAPTRKWLREQVQEGGFETGYITERTNPPSTRIVVPVI
jgi:hypothetical protein